MKHFDRRSAPFPSPLRLFLTLLVIVFVAEAAGTIFLLVLLPRVHTVATSIADAAFLVVLSAPFLWWFIVRLLRRIATAEHVRAATMVAHTPNGIITISEQGLVEPFNPAAERVFGYGKAEVVGKPVTILMPERYRDAHLRGLERLRSSGQSEILGRTIEVHGLRKDGSEFPMELSVTTWKAGKETFHTGIVRDITERRRAEEQLRLQSAALESTANAIVITDREGRITWVNPAFTRLTGYTAEEALGRNPRLLKSGKHDQAFYQRLWETILSGQVWREEMINRRKDGSLYVDEQTITPVRDERGEISHFVTIKQDITERKRGKEELQRSYDSQRVINSLLRFSLEETPVGDLLHRTLDLILSIPWLAFESRGSIFLVEGEPAVLVMKVQRGLAEPIQKACARVPFGKCLCGRAAATQEIQFADRLDDCHEVTHMKGLPLTGTTLPLSCMLAGHSG